MDCAANQIRSVLAVKGTWQSDILAICCFDAVIDDYACFEFFDFEGVCELVGFDLHSAHPLLGRRTDVSNVDRMLFTSRASSISEANQALCRAR